MSGKRCLTWGKNLLIYVKFCLNCGSKIESAQEQTCLNRRWSPLLTAGAVITMVGSCIALMGGLLGLGYSVNYYTGFVYGMPFRLSLPVVMFFAIGLLSIFGFAFGLTAGIMAMRRRRFVISIVGVAILTFEGFLSFFISLSPIIPGGLAFGLIFGTPRIVLSILGLVFIAKRKSEFES